VDLAPFAPGGGALGRMLALDILARLCRRRDAAEQQMDQAARAPFKREPVGVGRLLDLRARPSPSRGTVRRSQSMNPCRRRRASARTTVRRLSRAFSAIRSIDGSRRPLMLSTIWQSVSSTRIPVSPSAPIFAPLPRSNFVLSS